MQQLKHIIFQDLLNEPRISIVGSWAYLLSFEELFENKTSADISNM